MGGRGVGERLGVSCFRVLGDRGPTHHRRRRTPRRLRDDALPVRIVSLPLLPLAGVVGNITPRGESVEVIAILIHRFDHRTERGHWRRNRGFPWHKVGNHRNRMVVDHDPGLLAAKGHARQMMLTEQPVVSHQRLDHVLHAVGHCDDQ